MSIGVCVRQAGKTLKIMCTLNAQLLCKKAHMAQGYKLNVFRKKHHMLGSGLKRATR